jgi:uncharacterized protein (TIGR02246 family)
MRGRSIFALVVLVSACADPLPRVDVEAEGAELMRISREWSSVASTGDMEATLSYWAEDATMMAPGQPPMRGKQAIREYLESTSSIPGFTVRWEPLEAHVAASGDLAYLIERNQFSYQDSTGARITESNKVVTVWRKESDDSWKNVIDMWNADPNAWQ